MTIRGLVDTDTGAGVDPDSRYAAASDLSAHTGTSSIHAPIPAVISDGDIDAGTGTTQGTITAAGLKRAAEVHGGGGVYGPTFRSVSGATTAVAGDALLITSAGTDYTINLPASPVINDVVTARYVAQTIGDVVTLDPGSETINGAAASLKMFIADSSTGAQDYVELIYTGATWAIVRDGRVPHVCELLLTADNVDPVVPNLLVPLDTTGTDNALLADLATYSIKVRRAGLYVCSFSLAQTVTVDGRKIEPRVLNKDTLAILASSPRIIFHTGEDIFRPNGGSTTIKLIEGDAVILVSSSGGSGSIRSPLTYLRLVEYR